MVFHLKVVMLVSFALSDTSRDLSEAEFQQLHQELDLQDETWKSIPWRVSLLEAQQTAAQKAKPIFIWAMDGHPLGCT